LSAQLLLRASFSRRRERTCTTVLLHNLPPQ
jgi:hypothetical protein